MKYVDINIVDLIIYISLTKSVELSRARNARRDAVIARSLRAATLSQEGRAPV
ncbi:hypothetical protein [Thermogladius sp.]|uniref:hypothetical protein n=1 Tax=Thermogladius sp. TaxID=2023064 RepID=UPI003D0B0087